MSSTATSPKPLPALAYLSPNALSLPSSAYILTTPLSGTSHTTPSLPPSCNMPHFGVLVAALVMSNHEICPFPFQCATGLTCCQSDDFGHCFNKSLESCVACKDTGDDFKYPCPTEKPHCCASSGSHLTFSCYGEGQKCCDASGHSANNSDFCIGSCGVTTDPFTKCCVTTKYSNQTQCCSGKGICDVATHTCNSCGCIELDDPTTECCGGNKFDNSTKKCCSSHNHDICDQADTCSGCGCLSGPEMKCCGTKQYNTTTGETCCSNHEQSPFSDNKICNATQSCHSFTGGGPGQTEICCTKGWTLCEHDIGYRQEAKCMDPSTSICCTGAVCSKTLGSTCCDGKCCA